MIYYCTFVTKLEIWISAAKSFLLQQELLFLHKQAKMWETMEPADMCMCAHVEKRIMKALFLKKIKTSNSDDVYCNTNWRGDYVQACNIFTQVYGLINANSHSPILLKVHQGVVTWMPTVLILVTGIKIWSGLLLVLEDQIILLFQLGRILLVIIHRRQITIICWNSGLSWLAGLYIEVYRN